MSEAPAGTRLNYAGKLFRDEDLEELPLRDARYPYEDVDFSQNGLSADGLRKVLDLCLQCEKLKVLRLYKNNIDDAGAEALAEFITKCGTIEEMHLSHNRFTAKGVTSIVAAAEQNRPPNKNPLWLRLEQNDVADPNKVIKDLQSQYSVCARHDRVNCIVKHCIKGKKVHLPHFHFQRGGPQEGEGEELGGRRRRRKRKRWEDEEAMWDWKGGTAGDWWDEHAWGQGWSKDGSPPRRSWAEGLDGPNRQDWRAARNGGHGWPAEPLHEPRPARGSTQVGGGIFLRAVAAAVKKERVERPERPAGALEVPVAGDSRRPGPVPANVAARTLSRLGVLTEKRRNRRVQLKEGPASAGGQVARTTKEELNDETDRQLGSTAASAASKEDDDKNADGKVDLDTDESADDAVSADARQPPGRGGATGSREASTSVSRRAARATAAAPDRRAAAFALRSLPVRQPAEPAFRRGSPTGRLRSRSRLQQRGPGGRDRGGPDSGRWHGTAPQATSSPAARRHPDFESGGHHGRPPFGSGRGGLRRVEGRSRSFDCRRPGGGNIRRRSLSRMRPGGARRCVRVRRRSRTPYGRGSRGSVGRPRRHASSLGPTRGCRNEARRNSRQLSPRAGRRGSTGQRSPEGPRRPARDSRDRRPRSARYESRQQPASRGYSDEEAETKPTRRRCEKCVHEDPMPAAAPPSPLAPIKPGVKVVAARPKGQPKRQPPAGTAGGRPTATKATPTKPPLHQQAPAMQPTPVRTAGTMAAAKAAAAAAAATTARADANESEYTSYTVEDDDSAYTDAEESEEEEQKIQDSVVNVERVPATSQAKVVRTGAGGQAAAAKKNR